MKHEQFHPGGERNPENGQERWGPSPTVAVNEEALMVAGAPTFSLLTRLKSVT
jgi:hypothetical protein